MSQLRRVHLFNCDRTYKFDSVEDLLEATKAKVSFVPVKRHNFTLGQMSEMITKIPSLEMDVAIFVVHAHESRLSINEDNAGIGYAKIYRALLKATGEKVIIVIGGDDNYRDEDEEDQVVISRWAKRKISSQFNEEFLDGRKSFIFSWNKKHRPIHEKALMHYFDPGKEGQKFEYQPKPKQGESSKTAQSLSPRRPLPKPQSMDEQRGEDRSFIRSYSVGQKRQDSFTSSTKSAEERGKQGLLPRSNSVVQRGEYPSFSHTNSVQQKREDNLFGGPNSAEQRYEDSLFGPPYSAGQGTEYGTVGPTTAHLSNVRGARPKEIPAASSAKRKDLAVLGWQAKPEWMLAAQELIAKNKKDLNLAEDPDILDKYEVTELTSYLQNNPLNFCVLLVDAEKVKAAITSPTNPEADYLGLQETAEKNVARKIIIVVCCESSFPQEEKKMIDWKIKSKFKEKDKVYITTFKKGKIELEPKHFVQVILSSIRSTNPEPPERRSAHQTPAIGPTQHPLGPQSVDPLYPTLTSTNPEPPERRGASKTPALGPTQHPLGPQSPCPLYPSLTAENQRYPHPQGIVTNQPSYPAGVPHLRPALAPAKTVMLNTRLRNGRISNRPEDVVYWKQGWVVPDNTAKSLFLEHSKTPDAELVILSDEKGGLIYQVNENKSSHQIQPEGHQGQGLAPDEVIKLKTRMYSGLISYDVKDVEISDKTWRVPKEIADGLKKDYKTIPKAELFIVRDSKDNLRCIVEYGPCNRAFNFINKKAGTNIFM